MKLLKFGIVLLCSVTLWGCGKGNSNAPVTIDPVSGKHQPGWVAVGTGGAHPAAYLANPATCVECHGIPADLAGGISRISCSGGGVRNGIQCHANFPHQIGFDVPDVHGPKAKSPKGSGFATCINCHGADFKGNGAAPSCIACHLSRATYTLPEGAPHSPAPWIGGPRTHTDTDPSNAAVCANCHANGARTPLAHKDLVTHTPITAATPADCFNNTLCHGVEGHQNDPQPWTAAANHGASAKTNLSTCRACHATGSNPPVFTIPKTSMANGCQTCHTQSGLAHPYIWLLGTTQTTHATTTPLAINAYCVMCHGSNLNNPIGAVPSCFAPYPDNSPAGVTFKCHATNPVNNTNCTSCHGGISTGPNGTSFPNTGNAHAKHTFACTVCHNGGGSGTSLHGTRNAAAVSFLPSQAGATAGYDANAKTCTNVICHDGRTTTPAWTSSNNGCTACHISPPSTFRHPAHFAAISAISCDACHNDGPGVPTHTTQNPIVVGSPLPAKFNENGSIAVYGPTTQKCTNVSCHGGKDVPFPAWKEVRTFDPNALNLCGFSCHTISVDAPASYSGPYIGPFSGIPISAGGLLQGNLHNIHLSSSVGGVQINCANCHTIPVPGHFAGIMGGRRPLLPGSAAGTVGGLGTSVINYTTGTGSCTTASGCHTIAPADPRFWFK